MEMKWNVTNETLTVYPEGRIDSSNAEAVGTAIDGILRTTPHSELVLDVEKLEYLSSAGLRVVLKLRKGEKEMRVINASPEVYDIFDMTGFTEMMTIERAYRQLSVEGCQVIGRGARGIVYRYDADTIVKVYMDPDSLPDIRRERELARRAFVLGVPTAISYDIVRVGDRFGTMFELLDARSLTQVLNEDPVHAEAYLTEYARLLKKIHETAVKPDDMPDIKERAATWFDEAAKELPADTVAQLRGMIDAIPDANTMLHCDYHTNNVMIQGDEMLLIDMDTISRGHPIFDLAIIYSAYIAFEASMPGNSERFFGVTAEMAERIWNTLFSVYFEDKSEAERVEIADRIALLGTLRALNFTLRFGGREKPDFADRIAACRNRLLDLNARVSTLSYDA